MSKDINREQHSLLRSDWRAYLKEGIGTSDAERKLRERLRDRVVTGLYDVAILNQYARDRDIKQIFKRLSNDETANVEQSELVNGEEMSLYETHFVAAKALVSLAWRGLRECGVDQQRIFDRVVVPGIESGEADCKGVPHGRVESNMSLTKLETHTGVENIDPVEKVERELALSGNDLQTLHNRLSQHPDVDEIIGKNIIELTKTHLIDSDG